MALSPSRCATFFPHPEINMVMDGGDLVGIVGVVRRLIRLPSMYYLT